MTVEDDEHDGDTTEGTESKHGEEEEYRHHIENESGDEQTAKLNIFRHGTETAMKDFVAEAIKTRGEAANLVIIAELTQMISRKVWTPIYQHQLSHIERGKIIRSSMFLKEKFLATGKFEKLKARGVRDAAAKRNHTYVSKRKSTSGGEGRMYIICDTRKGRRRYRKTVSAHVENIFTV